MDSRDFLRGYSLSKTFNCNIYSVSMQQATTYHETHIYVNFNKSNFFNNIISKWGNAIKFNQIILDYYWIPNESWMKKIL